MYIYVGGVPRSFQSSWEEGTQILPKLGEGECADFIDKNRKTSTPPSNVFLIVIQLMNVTVPVTCEFDFQQ